MTFKLIKAGVAILALCVATIAAEAAEIPIKAPIYKGGLRSVVAYYNWTGFYVGINGGYGMGKSTWDSPAVSPDPKGATVGGTLGYNWQAGSFVYGLEADWDWSMMKGSAACGLANCETNNAWLATARLRLGYAFDRWLPYITGGGAYGKIEANNTNIGFSSASANRFGWTAGLGLEYAFLGNWSAKLEYLYLDLGSFDCGTACSVVTPDNVSFSANIIRAGLNYKFSGPVFSRF
jgi:outer membrane immunogenic protein